MRKLLCAILCLNALCIILLRYPWLALAEDTTLNSDADAASARQVEACLKKLESPDEKVQLEALATLKEMGWQAMSAHPKLLRFQSSPRCSSKECREAVAAAITNTSPPGPPDFEPNVKKPALYLYPDHACEVSIQVLNSGPITAAWPPLLPGNSWKVRARPNGEIKDDSGRSYRYLFWEGHSSMEINFDREVGFVVSGDEVREFLTRTLAALGLTEEEANDFIVFWYPILSQHRFNYIHFITDEYEKMARLKVIPKPDSQLRFFMLYQALDKEIPIIEQELPKFKRKGFTLVDWGGGEISSDRVKRVQ